MRTQAIIFDFDGTLANSFDIVVRIFKTSSSKHKRINEADIEHFRTLSARDVLRQLGVRWWQVPWLLAKGRREMTRQMNDVELFDGLKPVLESLHANGYQLFIASSNSVKNILFFLNANEITRYFSGVHGNAGIFGKSRGLKKIIKDYNLNPDRCYYIGDEVRDIDAAEDAGLHSVVVSWGYNSPAVLLARKPDQIVQTPRDILKLLS